MEGGPCAGLSEPSAASVPCHCFSGFFGVGRCGSGADQAPGHAGRLSVGGTAAVGACKDGAENVAADNLGGVSMGRVSRATRGHMAPTNKPAGVRGCLCVLAETVRFELTDGCPSAV